MTNTLLDDIALTDGQSLLSLTEEKPVMLVFLRHFGCVFCQEALRDLAENKAEIENRGCHVVFVHMQEAQKAETYFEKNGLSPTLHISDQNCDIYERFGLVKGSFSQLFGLRTMVRGFQAGMSMKQFGGGAFGDAFQMPGIFILINGEVKAKFIHQTVSDRPDYMSLLNESLLN